MIWLLNTRLRILAPILANRLRATTRVEWERKSWHWPSPWNEAARQTVSNWFLSQAGLTDFILVSDTFNVGLFTTSRLEMTSWEKTLRFQKSEEESKISLALICCLYGAIGNTVVVVVVHAMEDHSKWLTDYLRQTHNMNAGQIVTLHHTYSHHRCQTHFQDGCCRWKTSFCKFISNWCGKRKF